MFFDALVRELKIRNSSEKTIKAYCWYNKDLLKYTSKTPPAICEEDIRSYVCHLLDERKVAPATARLAVNAIKFYYGQVMRRPFRLAFRLPKGERRLPVVLSQGEIERLLAVVTNPKHWLLLALMYSAGLRVSEAVSLRVQDIDFDRQLIWVRHGKGAKDRRTPLAHAVVAALHAHITNRGGDDFLFRGQQPGRHLSSRAAEKIFTAARCRASIKKPAACHSLRHSFATHLLENGTSIRYIQELLGHSRLETTQRYTRVASSRVAAITSPFDSADASPAEFR